MPFTTDVPVKNATIANPRTMSAKYSGGPKRNANFATGGAKNISPKHAKSPGDKGRDRGDTQGSSRPTLTSELVTVEAGDHG